MKRKFTFLITAAVLLLTTMMLPVKAWATAGDILNETFETSSTTASNWVFNQVPGHSNGYAQIDANSAYEGEKGLHLGSGKKAYGSATTPTLSAMTTNATMTFWAKTNANNHSLKLSASGCTIDQTSIVISNGTWTQYTVNITDGTSSAVINFYKDGSTTKYIYIDNVVITSVTSGPTQLTAPTNFAATAGNGEATFTWDAVTNAGSYTISYTPNGGTEQTAAGLTGTSTTITSLTNGTAYTCKIKAVSTNTNYTDSNYSSTITVTPTEPVIYTVTLDPGNGSVEPTTWYVTINNGNLPNATPPCNTWTFYGWSEAAINQQTTTAPNIVNTAYNPTSDITLYAVYKKTEGGGTPTAFSVGNTGTYAIVSAPQDSKYYALPTNPTVSGGKITAQEIIVSELGGVKYVTTSDASGFEWTISSATNGYSLSDGTKEIYHSTGGNSGTNLAYGDNTDSYTWSFTADEGYIKMYGMDGSTVGGRGMLFNGTTIGGYSLTNWNTSGYYKTMILPIVDAATSYYHSTPDCTETVATPTFDVEPGIYYETKLVIIECETNGAAIYYTLNGDEPTNTTSATNFLYNANEGVEISSTTTLKAKAFKTGMNPSAIKTATYTIIHDVAEPALAQSQVFTTDTYSVSITVPANTTVYYTIDGTEPTNASTPYAAAFNISETTTVKAIAYDNDGCFSDVVSATYTKAYTLAGAKALYQGTNVSNVTISLTGVQFIAKSGSSTYMQQGTTGLMIYGSHSQDLTNGDVFTAGTVTGTITKYGENLELSISSGAFANVAKTAGTLTASATGVGIDDITGGFSTYESRYVTVESLEMDITGLELSDGTNTLAIYDPFNILDGATQPDDNVFVTGVVTSYYKNSATTYQIIPLALTDITTGLDAELPALAPVGGATAAEPVTTDNVTITPATSTTVTYQFGENVGEITSATVLTVPSASATALEVVASRDFYTDNTATYYYNTSVPTHDVTFYVNGTADPTMAKDVVDGGELGTLPTATAPNGYTFMGWTESPISGIQAGAPTMVASSTPVNDDMDLYAVFAIENESVSSETVTLTANTSWSGYQDKTFTDDAGNEWTANCTGNNVSGTYYYGLNADVSSFVHSPNFSGTITGIKIWGKNGSSKEDRTFYIKSTQSGISGDLGTVLVPASTDGEELTATLTGSFTSFYLGASGALQFSKLQVSYNGVSNSYSNYCTSVTPIEDNDLPINNNNELTQDYTISGVNYLDTYIIVPDGITLTVDGVLGNSDPDFLVIEDGGQLIHSVDVSATMMKNITGYGDDNTVTTGWYTIASSVAGSAIGTATVGTYDLYRYDEENVLWLNQELPANSALFTNFNQGVGYLYSNAAQTELQFAGEMVGTNTTINVPLSCSATNVNLQGFNLVGNPFTRNLVAGDVNILDAALTSYYYVAGGSELTSALISGRPIKPGEGFFVKTSTAGNLVINPSSKGGRGMDKPAYVRIEAGNESYMDQAYIQIGQGNTLNKMTINDNVAHVSVLNDHAEYAVATIEAAQGEMPVNFKAAENGTYTISVEAENLDVNYLHLIDNITSMDVDLLATPSYTFEGKRTDYASRFKLVFSANADNNENDDDFAFISDGNLIIFNEGEATLQVIDIMGRIVSTQTVNGNTSVNNVGAAGVYVLQLINGNNVKTQKIVVR